jgi:hypothetical protein
MEIIAINPRNKPKLTKARLALKTKLRQNNGLNSPKDQPQTINNKQLEKSGNSK